MKANKLRIALICLTLFVGLGAVWGGVTMLIDPSGVKFGYDGLLPGLQKLPFADVVFKDLVFLGISLLIVNGLTQLIAAWLLIKKRKKASKLAAVCGVLLMLWITIQFFIFPFNWLSTTYFILGLAEAALGLIAARREA